MLSDMELADAAKRWLEDEYFPTVGYPVARDQSVSMIAAVVVAHFWDETFRSGRTIFVHMVKSDPSAIELRVAHLTTPSLPSLEGEPGAT